ncbi:hypothetical protein DV515_00014704 [Chloebia gouldiae]|uniref:Uncharacterized protein n=1 Tax=Chloebia gouldiae TaxID=44316 RepID=A0A3L8RXH2_CHLGU|nr:hypothetical protein DV515_00014704 [Chloebia gouldiae]
MERTLKILDMFSPRIIMCLLLSCTSTSESSLSRLSAPPAGARPMSSQTPMARGQEEKPQELLYLLALGQEVQRAVHHHTALRGQHQPVNSRREQKTADYIVSLHTKKQ